MPGPKRHCAGGQEDQQQHGGLDAVPLKFVQKCTHTSSVTEAALRRAHVPIAIALGGLGPATSDAQGARGCSVHTRSMAQATGSKAWNEALRTVWVLSLVFGLMAVLRGVGIQFVNWQEPTGVVACDGVPFEPCQSALNAAASARAIQWIALGLVLCLLGFVTAAAERRRTRRASEVQDVPAIPSERT